jgi:predicted ribosomally synthesized peptide with SipW-like signal peptide
MRKIITGFLGLILVAGLVGGAAYALLSSQSTVSGVSFAVGNANLQVSPNGTDYSTDINFAGAFFTGLFPTSDVLGGQFQLKNNSDVNIALSLTGKLNNGVVEGAPGSWDALKDAVQVGFDYYDGANWVTAPGFATLNLWNTTGFTLAGGNLAQGTQRWYRMHVKISPDTDSTIAGKSLTSTVFTFTGTQAP